MKKKIFFIFLLCFIVLTMLNSVSAVCMIPYEYKAKIINFNEFSDDYVFVTLAKNYNGKINYQIINNSKGQVLNTSTNSSDESYGYNIHRGVYFVEKYNFKDINITQVTIPFEDGGGARYEYYYNFEIDENYGILNISDKRGIKPCGEEGKNYPVLREDYIKIISLEKANSKIKLEKTIWYFIDGSTIEVDSPKEDLETPTIEIYKKPAESFWQKFINFFRKIGRLKTKEYEA